GIATNTTSCTSTTKCSTTAASSPLQQLQIPQQSSLPPQEEQQQQEVVAPPEAQVPQHQNLKARGARVRRRLRCLVRPRPRVRHLSSRSD
ncbi:unnamed protein product, partial [Rotaria sordida]